MIYIYRFHQEKWWYNGDITGYNGIPLSGISLIQAIDFDPSVWSNMSGHWAALAGLNAAALQHRLAASAGQVPFFGVTDLRLFYFLSLGSGFNN